MKLPMHAINFERCGRTLIFSGFTTALLVLLSATCNAPALSADADDADSLRIQPQASRTDGDERSLRIPLKTGADAAAGDQESLRIDPSAQPSRDDVQLPTKSQATPSSNQPSGASSAAPASIGNLNVAVLRQARNVIQNLHIVTPTLLRGAQPSYQGLQMLKNAGVKTIVNLRNEDVLVAQEASQAKMLGLNYVSIPLGVFNAPTDKEIRKFMTAVTNSDAQPLFVHCLHGQDRTGTLCALYRIDQQGWAADRAYQEMLSIGYRPMFGVLTKTVFDYSAKHGRLCQPPPATVVVDDVKNRMSKFMHHH